MKKILQRMPRMLLVGVILLILLAGSALAYLFSSTREGATSNFTPAKDSDPTINDTSFYVNVGDPSYAVYVRAVIVVNWEEDGKEGTYHATAPVAGTDYTLTLNTSDWFNGSDGFYYHKAMVDSNSTTAKLINSCTAITPGPDVYDENGNLETDYKLNVQLIAQTIQALGTTDNDVNGNPVAVGIPAVEDAWKVVTVDSNGSLIPITP